MPYGGITADLQSYGKFSQHYGFFEFSAKMPHDYAGEGDGLHPTLWFIPTNKTGWNIGCGICGNHGNYGAPEIDLNEDDIGQGNRNTTGGGGHDYCSCEASWYPQPQSSVGDLSAGFHTYGLYWRNDGSGPNGSVQSYVDGVAQYAPHVLDSNQPFWNNPIYPLIWMDPCAATPGGSSYYGGAICTSNTSSNDPFVVRYFRAWQAY
jgi:beta-glucanase (GH16 family)